VCATGAIRLRRAASSADHGVVAYPADVPTLTDGVVTLRAHTLDDVDGVVEQCTDPDTIAWTTVPNPYTRDDAVTWVTKIVPESWAGQNNLGFAVEAAHDDGVRRFAGGVNLRPKGDGAAGIGFGLHPGVRGRGVCTRAVKLLLDWAFTEFGVAVVTWHAVVGNWASRRVAWANGFSVDGTIAGFLLQRGERRDAWTGTLRAWDSREPKTTWYVPVVMETARLRLRPVSEADTDRLAEMVTDERSRHFGGGVRRPEDGPSLLNRLRERNATGQSIDWCIANRETDQLVGHLQLFNLADFDPTQVDAGYSVHPDARGRGLLTEALGALVEWTFRPADAGGLGKRRITIQTAASNTASRYAAERAGFSQVASMPQAFPVGQDFDHLVIYHRLNHGWRP
jgi:RimJ/RimL family protein N-acetyltransferase